MTGSLRRPSLGRRAFIGGAGAVTVALPFLEALEPRPAAAQAPSNLRFLSFFVPNGKHMPFWTPTSEGADFVLPPTLEPLAGLKQKLLVLSGLANAGATRRVGGDHARGTGSFLTCTNIHTSEEINQGQNPNTISLDQVLAREVGGQSRLRSLQLGLSNEGGDQGYPSEFIQNVSFDEAGRFLPKTVQVDSAFEQIFAGYDPSISDAEVKRRNLYKTSVLDYVTEQATELRPRISQNDVAKLDQYLTSVRELEQRIQNSPELSASCAGAIKPGNPSAVPERIQAMLDVLVLALQCDATRVVTYMMGNGGDGAINGFPWLGFSDHHHGIAHHQQNTANYDKLKLVDRWEIEQLKYLLEKLDAVPEANGTLLDHCIVLYSSEISDGNRHNHNDLPVLLAGGGAAGLALGKHQSFSAGGGRPIAELYVSILQAMGTSQTQFADGAGPLPGLTL